MRFPRLRRGKREVLYSKSREWLCNEFFTVLTGFSTEKKAVQRKNGEKCAEIVENSSLWRIFQLFSTGFTVEIVENSENDTKVLPAAGGENYTLLPKKLFHIFR